MKKVLLILLCGMLFISCSKDDEELKECERDNIGYVTILNQSNIKISTVDALIVNANSSLKIGLPANQNIKVWVYVDLWDSSAPKYSYDVNLKQCENKTITFTQAMDTRPDCQKRKVGYLQFVSQTKNPYDLYINDVFVKQISGNSTEKIEKEANKNYSITLKQVSGYVLYPTIINKDMIVSQCSTNNLVFP